MLCQLSYAPGLPGVYRRPPRAPKARPTTIYAASVQRRALGILFAGLALLLAATAAAALLGAGGSAKGWVIGVAALALAGWLASLAAAALRRR